MANIKEFLNKNISKKDQKMLIILLGLVLLGCSYFFGYKNVMGKMAEQDSKNSEKIGEINILREYANNQGTYEQEIAKMNLDIQEIKNSFPSQIHSENSIVNALQLERDCESLNISNISMGENLLVYSTAQDSQVESEIRKQANTMGITPDYMYELFNIPVTYQFNAGYSDFKDMITSIKKNVDTKSVESVVMTYDSTTSNLLGTLIINQYTITGTDREYITPEVKASTVGNPNPFATTE